ncbi:MAG: ribulose-phosphate 3-epimerase [Candidatus Obscuribacterales bacterium]|nr:ribulose-phosphate 3-epimerase [Candidatus Obscuribacterales bacterium]
MSLKGKPPIIAPSILSADFCRLGEQINMVQDAGADWIHVDVMDGHFVPNLTIGWPVVQAIRKTTNLPLDCHLMIQNPDLYLENFAEAGADYITVHEEACPHLERTLSHIRKLGKKAGVALNPHTSQDTLHYVSHVLDLVLVMSVNPGFGGQNFIEAVIPKISKLKAMFAANGRDDILISVDGGINNQTAAKVLAQGADVLVAGKTIYGAADPAQAIRELKAQAQAVTH